MDNIKLRDYQVEPINIAIDYFCSDSDKPCLIVLPTAWGKSVLTAFVAKYINPNERLLVVQPSKELLEQNYAKYVDLCGGFASAGIYSASVRRKEVERITYATIGSIKDMGKRFKEMGFTKMLIDEAHLYPRNEESMLGGFLKESGIRQVLGITATPLKLEQFSEKQGDMFDKWSELIMLTNPSPSGTLFEKILYVGQIEEMTQKRFWSPLIYERLPFNPSELQLNNAGSEFTSDSAEKAYRMNNIRKNIYAALDWHKERRHCLVFVPSVEEAEELAKDYPSAAYISGEMNKKERERIVKEFKEGNIRVIFNCSVLGTGFDYPEIDMIVFAMSTASVARYYQFCGRGVRIHPAKKNCLIVDMGGNVDRFGRIEDLKFEHTDKWRLYGTNGILLSGLPIGVLGVVNRRTIEKIGKMYITDLILGFGKYKGQYLKDIPMSYKIWLLKSEMRNSLRFPLFETTVHFIENRLRDTTKEPMMMKMPDGTYAGMMIKDVPKNYLAWYYNSKTWNNCNDSLRRGIEHFYGRVPPYFNPKGGKKKA